MGPSPLAGSSGYLLRRRCWILRQMTGAAAIRIRLNKKLIRVLSWSILFRG
ncbi:MAG: hypothetical protein M3Q49_21420 [Actinomycetota bacterium]|nr:hypothetical protein [Actinomycetota bacterium]